MYYCQIIFKCENNEVSLYEKGYDDIELTLQAGRAFFERHPALVPYLRMEITCPPEIE